MSKVFSILVLSVLLVGSANAQNIDNMASIATYDMQQYSSEMESCNIKVLNVAENLASSSFESQQVKQTINCYLDIGNKMLSKYYQDEREIIRQELHSAAAQGKETLEESLHNYINNIKN